MRSLLVLILPVFLANPVHEPLSQRVKGVWPISSNIEIARNIIGTHLKGDFGG